MNPEISVVILCYKAGYRIEAFVDKVIRLLEKIVSSWEIILVGNYWENSGDETPDAVRKLAAGRKNIKAVAMPKKGMMGWDAQSGLKEATGRLVCMIDGDEQMPPEDIARVYDKITRDNLDFVKTFRLKRDDGIFRKLNSLGFNCIFRLLFPAIKVRDVNSKPKIFTRDAYAKMRLTSDDRFFDTEMILECGRLKLRMGEIPTKFHRCAYRKSFVKLSAIFEFIRNLIRARIKTFYN